MSWKIEYLEEAAKDIRKLDGSIRKQYARAIEKVAKQSSSRKRRRLRQTPGQ